MNVVILSGRLLTEPTSRALPAGGAIWALDLATAVDESTVGAAALPSRRVTVPVVWSCDAVPPSWGPDTEVVVAGVVRRRFFRSGGGTQSRTEVVASAVIEVTKRRSAARALERALGSLGAEDRSALRSTTG